MLQQIRLFSSAGKGRGLNDANNRIREDILCILHRVPEHFILDNEYGQEWSTLAVKWNQFLKTLCPHEYDDIEVKKIANQKQYDLDIQYKKQNQIVHSVLGEFKHNTKTLSSLPQYYSVPEKKGYILVRYAEFFYDNYLDQLCELIQIPKLQKDTYMKCVYQPRYTIHRFFEDLKNSESTYYREKQSVVRQSIKDYLNQYANEFSIEALTKDILPQQSKTFILWDCNEFRSDRIHPDELQLEAIEKVHRNNTIIVRSKAGTKHKLLLRWRNHLGVLYPAWQISLDRSAKHSQVLS
jgi:hypothetical protein